jgi:sirohydrochlorin cobaltochelatase
VRAEAVTRVRELIELQHQLTQRDVMVIPVLVSRGTVSRSKVAADIAGTRSRYVAETLLPHPAMARWIESRVRSADTEPARAAVSTPDPAVTHKH